MSGVVKRQQSRQKEKDHVTTKRTRSKADTPSSSSASTTSSLDIKDVLDSVRLNFNGDMRKSKSNMCSPTSAKKPAQTATGPATPKSQSAPVSPSKPLSPVSSSLQENSNAGSRPCKRRANAKSLGGEVKRTKLSNVKEETAEGSSSENAASLSPKNLQANKKSPGRPLVTKSNENANPNATKGDASASADTPASAKKNEKSKKICEEPAKSFSGENARKNSPRRVGLLALKSEVMPSQSGCLKSKEAKGGGAKQIPSADSSKPRRLMDEVSKLHQDEGVIHLLHALPASRRKTQVSLFNAAQFSPSSSSLLSTLMRRPGSASPAPSPTVSASATITSQQSGRDVPIVPLPKKTSLSSFASVSPDQLLNPITLELLKTLPKEDYVELWSGTDRYRMTKQAMRKLGKYASGSSGTSDGGDQLQQISPSDSDISSASALAAASAAAKARSIGSRMLTVVTNINKQYKDILIRSYPTFAQIILAPTTTVVKHSINVNLLEEVIDAMKLLAAEEHVRAILITGMGATTFSRGLDLTGLTHDSTEKQRRSAESLATAVKTFVKFLLSYPKLLVAGVNGNATGFACTMLPLFDIVYASDKAVFGADFAKLGQIPEGCASVTLGNSRSMVVNEMLLLGRTLTAMEMAAAQVVSAVILPDRFLEEIVPKMEQLENSSTFGLRATKALMKESLKKRVLEVIEEETRQLVSCWTRPDFARSARSYLKTATDIVFQ